MLSQLENGRLTPTLPTLARISMVFDVGMDYFFSDRDRASVFHVVRASDRLRLPSNPNDTEPAWQFECLAFPAVDKEIQAYLALFEPRPHASAEHSHEGSELIFVLDGPLVITHVHRTVTLESGDSAWFDGRLLHGYQAPGPGQARAVVVTAPAAK
jgi:quercetin dioxygenase-like cupin family protein